MKQWQFLDSTTATAAKNEEKVYAENASKHHFGHTMDFLILQNRNKTDITVGKGQ